MTRVAVMIFAAGLIVSAPAVTLTQEHRHGQHTQSPMHSEKMPAKSALQPAEGAQVVIRSPKEGQTIRGDIVPLEFKLTKGKKGAHVHAYIDGELAGMFNSEKGSLTGVKPGAHTLELRVATEDHNTELNAIDRVNFIVK